MPPHWAMGAQQSLRKAEFRAKRLIRPLFRNRNRLYNYYAEQIFTGFDEGVIREKVAKIEELMGRRFRIIFFGDELFAIESDH